MVKSVQFWLNQIFATFRVKDADHGSSKYHTKKIENNYLI